ncbi:thioredoxin domain-containing protein [Candidatus Woesearchaeota archaeon]|nr:thioredoxin domain-containing protein [Candidatus Woesearchaeota archaeon]
MEEMISSEESKPETTHEAPKKVHVSHKPKKAKNPWKYVSLVLAILLVISVVYIYKSSDRDDSTSFVIDPVIEAKNKILIDDDEVLGDPKAPITMVVFSDYQCPFCSRHELETMPNIIKNYVDTGKVKYVFRDLPLSFHPFAQKAAEASECAAEQGKFWEYNHILFQNNQALDIPNLKKYAADLGLNTEQFDECLDTGKYEEEVLKDAEDAGANGISGTPASLVNGELISGAQPYQIFAEKFEEILGGEAPAPAPEPEQPEIPGLQDTSNDPEIKLTVINDKDCAMCDTSRVLETIEGQLFPTAEVTELDVTEAKNLIKELKINALPAYVFDSKIKEAANYGLVQEAMIDLGDKVMIHPASVEAALYLTPPPIDDDPMMGEVDAKVTIIEFTDYECPFCGKYTTETLPQIKKEYIDTGKVRYVLRDFTLSFHENAEKAAEAAECADDQGMYWEFHDLLFENQASLSIEKFKEFAEELDLDTDEFNDCLDSAKYADEIAKDIEDAVEFGVGGTPAFFVNGYSISGAMPFEAFKQIIDAELEN